jgi:hypothetical protein
MTKSINAKSGRTITFAAGLAVAAMIGLGAVVSPASADDRWHDHRDGDFRGDRGHGGWGGGWHRAPPVVYGSPYYEPYYAPPPVVYAPTVGIAVPGVTIGIH